MIIDNEIMTLRDETVISYYCCLCRLFYIYHGLLNAKYFTRNIELTVTVCGSEYR